MTPNPAAPWHTATYETFIATTLPDLLSARVPLEGYASERVDDYRYKVSIVLRTPDGTLDLEFSDVPAPDRHGVFSLPPENGGFRVVVPVPDQLDLAAAKINCVGEQLADYVEKRLGDAPDDLEWDQKLAEAWLPITGWVEGFLRSEPTSQYIQSTNWLDRYTHLRRITALPLAFGEDSPYDRLMKPEDAAGIVPRGLACPIIMPEGPNMGWIVEVARGAEIRDGRLVRAEWADDSDPTLDLGWSGSMIPFIEHSDSSRLLMGANMMRQWIAPRNTGDLPSVSTAQTYGDNVADLLTDPKGPKPEPALVRTGTESDDPDSWAGYNLLTAFTMWDGDTFEDGVVLSESGAAKMAFPYPVDPGDKVSTRHGVKGVVSRILPDSRMPTLPDGTAVDAIISPTSIVSRMVFGLLREAVMGRIAHAEGKPAIVPAYQAPTPDELHARLAKAGLPEDGMETLTVEGEALPRRVTVGYVYWGRLTHLSRDKMKYRDQSFEERQYAALKWIKAPATISDTLTRAGQAGYPVPTFESLSAKLSATGIHAERKGDTVVFKTNGTNGYALSAPVPHPWNPEISLSTVPEGEGDQYEAVLAADERVRRLGDDVPEPLRASAIDRLSSAVSRYLDVSLGPDDLLIDTRVPDSGRAVATPGPGIPLGQIGLPRDLAWDLFGSDVASELGEESVKSRTDEANTKLEAVAASTHLLLHKNVHTTPTSIIAVTSVLVDEPVIRLHPFYCSLIDADFDGDQVGVYRPGSDEAIEEARDRLSIQGHLRHTYDAFRILIHRPHAICWGLSNLARTAEGRDQISKVAGEPIPDDYYGKRSYQALLERIYEREGTSDEGLARTFEIFDALVDLGFRASKQSGASISPFLGEKLDLPVVPSVSDPELYHIYKEELIAVLDQETDPDDDDVGTFNTFRLTQTRGSNAQYALYFGAHGLVETVPGQVTEIRQGLIEGLTLDGTFAQSARSRAGISRANREVAGIGERNVMTGRSYGVIARARRSNRPGVVFARAAVRGEVDPLRDEDARYLCGLPVA